MKTWISWQGQYNLAFVLILGLINRCVGGLIEYSSFSDDDIMLEMQMFNEVDDVINECMVVELDSETNELDLDQLEMVKDLGGRDMFKLLEMELKYLIIYKYEYKKENAAKYLGFWALQVLAAEYSVEFINGYMHYESSNPDLALQCLFLGRYLAVFAGIRHFSEVFPKRVTYYIKSDQGCANNPAYLTAFTVRNTYSFKIASTAMYKIISKYNAEKGTLNTANFIEDREERERAFSIVKLFLAHTIFGKKMINENMSNIPDDDQLWRSVRRIMANLNSSAERFDKNPPDDESYLTLEADLLGPYPVDKRARNEQFLDTLKKAESYQKGAAIIEDQVSWDLAGELITFFSSETSSSGSEPKNEKFESRLVKIIRTLEKKRASLYYKGNSFEESASGFTDGAKLALERDSNSNSESIIFHVVKKNQ